MVRSVRTIGLSVVLLLGITSVSSAQFFVGAGPTFPNGDYSKYAKTGWMASLGYGFDIGTNGLWVAPEFLYGSNSHDVTASDVTDGDKTNLFGFDAALGYTMAREKSVRPYFFGLLGTLNHQWSPANGDSENEWGFVWGVGAGLNFKLSEKMSLWGEARYMARDHTNFIPLLFGLQFGGN